jgi:hypothetical protein
VSTDDQVPQAAALHEEVVGSEPSDDPFSKHQLECYFYVEKLLRIFHELQETKTSNEGSKEGRKEGRRCVLTARGHD